MCEDIIAIKTAQIEKMQTWRHEWCGRQGGRLSPPDLVLAVVAFDLSRAVGALAGAASSRTAPARSKPGWSMSRPAIAASAHRIRIRLPQRRPWQQTWERLLATSMPCRWQRGIPITRSQEPDEETTVEHHRQPGRALHRAQNPNRCPARTGSHNSRPIGESGLSNHGRHRHLRLPNAPKGLLISLSTSP